MDLEVTKQTETADSVWEPRYFKAEAGRLFMFLAPQGYETELGTIPEDAPCIFSVPCQHIETALPTWKRNGAPDAFKLLFFERELNPEAAMEDTSLAWDPSLPHRIVIAPIAKDRHVNREIQLQWLQYIERGRRSFFVWLQSVLQNLELDMYARRYSEAHTAMVHAESDDEEDEGEEEILARAELQAIVTGEAVTRTQSEDFEDDDNAYVPSKMNDEKHSHSGGSLGTTKLLRSPSFDIDMRTKAATSDAFDEEKEVAELRGVFNALDLDENGVLDRYEVQRAAVELERPLNDDQAVDDAMAVMDTGACGYNRPCAHQYVGKSQSCMVQNGRLIPHASYRRRWQHRFQGVCSVVDPGAQAFGNQAFCADCSQRDCAGQSQKARGGDDQRQDGRAELEP